MEQNKSRAKTKARCICCVADLCSHGTGILFPSHHEDTYIKLNQFEQPHTHFRTPENAANILFACKNRTLSAALFMFAKPLGQRQQRTMASLPAELWDHVLAFVVADEYAAAPLYRFVCREWEAAVARRYRNNASGKRRAIATTCDVLARRGYLTALRWAHEEGRFPWGKRTCAAAGRGGQLEVLRWLREQRVSVERADMLRNSGRRTVWLL